MRCNARTRSRARPAWPSNTELRLRAARPHRRQRQRRALPGFIRRTSSAARHDAHTTFDAPAAAHGDYAWGYRLGDGETWSRERIEPDGEVGAMGGLATTVPDYARYVSFLLKCLAAAR